MKIKNTPFLLLLLMHCAFGQKIEVNNNKIITVIFPDNILKAVTGNGNYTVDFDKENLSTLLFIKAEPTTEETNLIVKTENNFLYNLTLIYTKTIPEEKTKILIESSRGIFLGKINKREENVIVKDTLVAPVAKEAQSIRENDYTIGNTLINDASNNEFECSHCESIIQKGKKIKRIYEENFDIKINIESLYYGNNELYVTVNIENNSTIDYYINYIKTYIQQKKDGKTASTQYLEKNPSKIYKPNRIISANNNRKMIFIYDQFTIDNNKNLIFELNEANGERNLSLIIPNYIINNPTKIK